MADRVIVEVPLDSDYLTDDGMYMAGYLWGRKVRNPDGDKDLNDASEVFMQGARDGYGDAMEKNREGLATVYSREASEGARIAGCFVKDAQPRRLSS